ncbi:Epimerase family protein [Vibrio stylophorae]|uniref:Epimerase family protein n=1 Tax=Vibrio stylophorae TaxID=659351 RepID=A0ABN8DTF8_9VIBR|nr:TIGR01777 family oxidoreductase [Vibrio stylophorae]CAH0534002.1 Epimerase family protein [Vibrio stylophorae]
MRVLLTGGTGFIGKHLSRYLNQAHLTVVSRNPTRANELLGDNIQIISSLEALRHLNDFDAVINLAGEPIVDKRWTKAQKRKICQSRWKMTRELVTLFKMSTQPPKVFLSGSAIGIYGDQACRKIDESWHDFHPGFTHDVCAEWERIALSLEGVTRVCLLRTGVVLGAKAGMLKKLLPVFKLGLGGPIGRGEQFLSWIHIEDMTRAILYLLNHDACHGVYNLTAPNPVTNLEFSAALAQAMHRPLIFRTPAWTMKLALGEASSLVLDSQRIYPKRLEQSGFHFHHPQLSPALNHLLSHETC